MSDHDAPHPVDQAYADAEAVLDDDAARRARRARILDVVAREAAPQVPVAPVRPSRSTAWRHVGWLTAASVAGLGALVTYQLSPTADVPPVASPDAVSSEPAPTPPTSLPPNLDAQTPVAPPPQARLAAPEERAPKTAQRAAVAAPPPAPVATPPVAAPVAAAESAAAPPRAPAAFPASQDRAESVEARRAAPPPMAAQAPSARVQAAPAAPPATLGARLRAAAAAGRTSEIVELLAAGAPVDARDSDGETALMKSIRANQPATAALLRRRGADPDLENRAGVSARDMAQAADNPALERALAPDR